MQPEPEGGDLTDLTIPLRPRLGVARSPSSERAQSSRNLEFPFTTTLTMARYGSPANPDHPSHAAVSVSVSIPVRDLLLLHLFEKL